MIEGLKKFISENKYLKSGLTIAVAAALLFLIPIAIQEKMNSGIKELRIEIDYKDKTKRLITQEYIKIELQKELGYDIERVKIEDLDLYSIEAFLESNKFISEAEVYIDAHNVIVATIIQKNPIVRINQKLQSFYLDEKGQYIPLSPVASVRVPVVTGKIDPFISTYKEDSKNQYNDIFELAIKINDDSFLNALIEQIHIENNKDFLLIPKIGKEKILLGEVYDIDKKMFALKQFYKEGLTRVGWGTYAYLDLKAENLVYAQRK